MSGSSMPTSREERVRSERARWFGSKASRSAACQTRARAAPLTFGRSLSARDAVARETPAAAATSASGGRRARFPAAQLTRPAIVFTLTVSRPAVESISDERRRAEVGQRGGHPAVLPRLAAKVELEE